MFKLNSRSLYPDLIYIYNRYKKVANQEQEEIIKLFKLYLEGGTTSREEAILFDYLNSDKDVEEILHKTIDNAWSVESTDKDFTTAANDELKTIWNAIDSRKRITVKQISWLKYAASIIVFCAISLLLFLNTKKASVSQSAFRLITRTTSLNEKIRLVLSDSSVVYLGSSSSISWIENLGEQKYRTVTLSGEAFFEVKHDLAHPFIVQTGKLKTQVLGTSFNIYAYKGDDIFSVSVKTGKVGVIESNAGVKKTLSLLTPGMQLVYFNSNGKFAVNTIETRDAGSWINNKFVFNDAKLSDMLLRLQHHYGVKFKLMDPKLASCRFNATFIDRSLTDIVEQLHLMSGGKIRSELSEDKKTIKLWGEACQ